LKPAGQRDSLAAFAGLHTFREYPAPHLVVRAAPRRSRTFAGSFTGLAGTGALDAASAGTAAARTAVPAAAPAPAAPPAATPPAPAAPPGPAPAAAPTTAAVVAPAIESRRRPLDHRVAGE
jgi:hypothetical protein